MEIRTDFKKSYSSSDESASLSEFHKDTNNILEELARNGFSEASVYAGRMCLDELFANAHRHGNQKDSLKKIYVEFTVFYKTNGSIYSPEYFTASIEDQGKGFNPEDIADPTLPENINKLCGRGLLLVKAYADEVHFEGNRVRVKVLNK